LYGHLLVHNLANFQFGGPQAVCNFLGGDGHKKSRQNPAALGVLDLLICYAEA
jgi:hypothetical protein